MSARAAIHGVGTSYFGKQPDLSPTDLAWAAVTDALTEAERPPVDAVYVGSVFGAPGVAARVLHPLGLAGVPILTVENACASGTSAFHEAVSAVQLGRHRTVLALGLEQMSTRFARGITPEPTDAEGASGLAMPALYALSASRYLHEGLVTREELAAVSVKNHRHALHNDRAQYRGDYTVEQVLAAAPIADPLTLLDCCPISDGAAAAVISASDGRAGEVLVRASAHRSGRLWDHRSPHVWGFDVVHDTSCEAFAAAQIDPGDIDVLEVHDAFTIGEIVTTEALGLAEIGGGGRLVTSGHTALGGAQPVNPSGGLLSRGHPLGATGLAQLAEITWQLRGDAGGRQVPGARLGVVETMGGGVAGLDGNACVVAVLEAPA